MHGGDTGAELCADSDGRRSRLAVARGVSVLAIAAALASARAASAFDAVPPELVIRVALLDAVGSVVVDGKVRRGPAELAAPGPHEVDGRRYRGAIEVVRCGGGLRIVNEVALEDYVAGTILGEVAEGFGPQVLRAQAIATRTYAVYQRAHPIADDHHVEAGTRSQVYLGLDGETDAVRDAVAATRGQVLTFGGEPILAAFHSAAGGRTATAGEVWGRDVPYLVSVGVPGEEDSPDTYWRAPVSAAELRAALAAAGRDVGPVRDVAIEDRTASGRAARVRIRGRDGDVVVSGEALRAAVGLTRLRSTLFAVRRTGDGFVFVGSGNGHGVGMSQWGARALARRGSDYRQILARFYPGARIETLTPRSAQLWGATSALAARGAADFGATP